MASRARVIDRDRGYRALMRRLKSAARRRSVTVGIHAEEGGAGHEESDLTVADVASIHEFGLNGVERSFLRAWADQDRDKHRDLERRMAESVVRGQNTVDAALEKMGVLLVAECQGFIQSDSVSPKTIKKDPQDNPTTLIATGQLVGSITHKVEA